MATSTEGVMPSLIASGDSSPRPRERFGTGVDDMWRKESALHAEARKTSRSPLDPFVDACLQLTASFRVYFKFLVTMESLFLSIISVASVLLFSLYEVKGQRLAVNVSWAFISFAIVMPLTNSLNEAFRRREEALSLISDVKAYLLSYYQGHRDWDWGENGRKRLPANHVSHVRFIIASLVTDMRDLLTSPPTARQIHFHTAKGRMQRRKMRAIQHEISARCCEHFDRVSLAVEELKYGGMPGNESARLRQYVTFTMRAWEKLKMIKRYRTPIATRAFARVYIFLHPIFWGPYYAYLVEQMLNEDVALGDAMISGSTAHKAMANVYACVLSVLTSLAMQGLFNVRYRMEDPFLCEVGAGEKYAGLDQIDVGREFAELMRCLCSEFKDADQNEAGGGPSRRVWPVPSECAIAHLEVGSALDVQTIIHHTREERV